MKWIVGIDLHPSSLGALRYATWLRERDQSPDGAAFVGVHVLEERLLRQVLRYHSYADVKSDARRAVDMLVERSEAVPQFVDLDVIRGNRADEALQTARDYHRADGIVVGRQAPADGPHVVRLGRVARRLLRGMKSPVIVVPPDLDPAELGPGPILVMTDLTPESAAACAFAAKLGQTLERELVLVHAIATPEEYAIHYLPATTLQKLRADHRAACEERLEAWTREHGFDEHDRVVIEGSVAPMALEVADRRQACMIVGGSRRLSLLDRVLITSVGSELAALAHVPVVLVPPPEG